MSCLLLGPMVGVPLLIRALDSEAWRVGAGTVRTRLARLSIIVGYGLSVVVLAGILLWPLYLFRYEPTRNADSFNDKRQRWYQGMFSAEEKTRYALRRIEPAVAPRRSGQVQARA